MTTKKMISLFLLFLMLITISVPATATTAPSGAVSGQIPTIVSTGNTTLANMRFTETGAMVGDMQTGDEITVTLPSGVVFQQVYAATATRNTPLFESPLNNMTVSHPEVVAGSSSVTLTLTRTADNFTSAQFLLKFPVNISTITSGAISVALSSNNPAINSGTFTLGTFGRAVVAVSATGEVGVASRFVAEPQGGTVTIRLQENAPGAFTPGTGNSIILRLPEGVTWSTPFSPSTGITATINPNNQRELILNTTTQSILRTTYTITPRIIVTRLASLGNLIVVAEGTGENINRTEGTAVLAQISDFGITVRRPTGTATPVIDTGRVSPSLPAAIELVETVRGSLISGGNIILTLPSGSRWLAGPTATATGGGLTVSPQGVKVSNSVYTFAVNNASTANGTVRFNIPAGAIAVLPSASGNLTVNVSGNAGAAGDVVIATIRAPFTISSDSAPRHGTSVSHGTGTGQSSTSYSHSVGGGTSFGMGVGTDTNPPSGISIGVNQGTAGNIVITENFVGGIRTGNIVLRLPTGIRFQTTPIVAVTDGNIRLGVPAVSGENVLTIPVLSASTVLSAVTIGAINYNIDRHLPDGDILVNVGGTSLFDSATTDIAPFKIRNGRIGARATTIFTVGASSFTRDGILSRIDAAPMIQNNRTLLPLRFVAQAIGINEDNIIWNPANRTVVILHNDRVIQIRIADRAMLVNGISVPLDAPAFIQNGRTFLPLRAIGLALRANIVWDATARTVAVTPQ